MRPKGKPLSWQVLSASRQPQERNGAVEFIAVATNRVRSADHDSSEDEDKCGGGASHGRMGADEEEERPKAEYRAIDRVGLLEILI